MSTSKLDRLNKLFEGDQRIAQADPNKPHIADLDFAPKASINKQAMPDPTPPEEPGKVPDVSNYLGSINPPSPRAGRDLDLLTSSDEDEYVAAFASKPTVKKPPTNFQPSGKSRRGGYKAGTLRQGNFAKLANELHDHDVDGKPLTGHFCPLSLVAKFPYKYMADTNGRVSRHFFAQNKFYERKWEIYYIDPPGSLMAKPIMLLPLNQVKHLMDQINAAFKTNIDCPPDPFTVSFFDDGTPQPKYLGVSRSRDDLADMEASIPIAPDDYAEYREDLPQRGAVTNSSSGHAAPGIESGVRSTMMQRRPTERSFAEYKAKMERIFAATKKNKQAVKKKKMDDRFLKQQDWAKQLKRAQRYLGLRPKATKLPVLNTGCSWAEQQVQQEQDLRDCGLLLDPLDVANPAPHTFESHPIIVCVDVEAYERDHRRITEIGVSTLDTLDLAAMPPGEGGENWIAQIRSRHFRIRGREHLENKDFCPGDANNFQFGKSEWVDLDAAAEAVDRCFEHPFSVHSKPSSSTHGSPPAANIEPAVQLGPDKRNIVLLGHDIVNEMSYLRVLGSQIFSLSRATHPTSSIEINAQGGPRSETLASIIEALDTSVLYKVLVRDTQSQSLGKVMLGLGRTAWHLHNAGNDARYTLEALIAMLIKARTLEDKATHNTGSTAKPSDSANIDTMVASRHGEVERPVKERTDPVEQDVGDKCKGWEKTLHTMTIMDSSGKKVEVEDPWLMAQESDQERSQLLAGNEDQEARWIDGADGMESVVYRSPVATNALHCGLISADALDSGEVEDRGRDLAKIVREGPSGKKRSGKRRGGIAERGTETRFW